jgi:hypothetical protein
VEEGRRGVRPRSPQPSLNSSSAGDLLLRSSASCARRSQTRAMWCSVARARSTRDLLASSKHSLAKRRYSSGLPIRGTPSP